jgi:hypothetical protein
LPGNKEQSLVSNVDGGEFAEAGGKLVGKSLNHADSLQAAAQSENRAELKRVSE